MITLLKLLYKSAESLNFISRFCNLLQQIQNNIIFSLLLPNLGNRKQNGKTMKTMPNAYEYTRYIRKRK